MPMWIGTIRLVTSDLCPICFSQGRFKKKEKHLLQKHQRFEHACGFFNDHNGLPVLMVAGGAVDRLTKDTKTATTELLLPGASSWIQATALPKAQGGVRAGSHLDGSGILLTGIETSVLLFNPETLEWEEVGSTKTRFLMHATVAGDLASLCQ